MLRWLQVLINCVWISEKTPDDWRRGIIIPFWKRKGDRHTCANRRGITLSSIDTRQLLAHPPSAVFGSIDRISLWDLIRISGTPPKLCCLLEHLYSDSESYVRDGNDLSEWFSIASGVRQGCVVALDLFNCVIDHLMCQTAAWLSLGSDLDNWRLTDMDYADDIALFSTSSLSKEAAMVGMSISWTKTKAMMISPSSEITTPINIDGELVEILPSFTYLGSIISADGSIEAEITSRIGKAAGAMKDSPMRYVNAAASPDIQR